MSIREIQETPDGQFLTYPSRIPNKEDNTVPKRLLDEIIERNISAYQLEELLTYQRLNQRYVIEHIPVEKLVGMDLQGKLLSIYVPNWEDSGWEYTTENHCIQSLSHDDVNGYQWVMVPAIVELTRILDEYDDDTPEYLAAEKALDETSYYDSVVENLNMNVFYTVRVLTPRV